jgi:tetratricopeptide (TPR) repeat protein
MRVWITALPVALSVVLSAPAFAAADKESGCVWPPRSDADTPAIIEACTSQLAAKNDDAMHADLLVKRGRAFKWIRRYADAANDLEEAIRLAPNDPVKRAWRGWIAYDVGNYQYATALAKQALAMQPAFSNAYDLLGSIAAKTGNLADAREAYNKAIAINPADLHARDNRLRLYRRAGAQQEELREIDEMLALKLPELDAITELVRRRPVSYRVKLRIERAELLKAMGRKQDAARAYDEFVRDDPGPVSYGMRAHFYNMMDDEARALTDIDQAIKADDKFAYLHAEKGFILNSLKHYDEAETSFTRAVVLDEADGPALWGRAKARRAMDRLEPAIADAQMALTIDWEFLQFKAKSLIELGYLPETADDKDALAAVKDAAQACMIDTRCW